MSVTAETPLDIRWAAIVGECPRLGGECRVYSLPDINTLTRVFQHGENPEHRMEIPASVFNTMNWDTAFVRVAEWVRSVHDYERQSA